MAHGALGGKLLGAGKGEFLMFFAALDHHTRISRTLPELKLVRFRLTVPALRSSSTSRRGTRHEHHFFRPSLSRGHGRLALPASATPRPRVIASSSRGGSRVPLS